MKKNDNIASIEGRLLLHEIYHKLKFEQQRNSISCLTILWKICTSETNVNKYLNNNVVIVHKLGIYRGTLIWLEEVVNRYYISTINSFVYLGAAIFLVLVGLNRFTDKIDNSMIIAGLVFEATMLLIMFFVMLFTPNEDVLEMKQLPETTDDFQQELLHEIGEISRDFAMTSSQLDKATDILLSITSTQHELMLTMENIAKTNSDAVQPNPKMIEIMSETNSTLIKFNETVEMINETANKLKSSEIELIVRQEIEKILTNRVSS